MNFLIVPVIYQQQTWTFLRALLCCRWWTAMMMLLSDVIHRKAKRVWRIMFIHAKAWTFGVAVYSLPFQCVRYLDVSHCCITCCLFTNKTEARGQQVYTSKRTPVGTILLGVLYYSRGKKVDFFLGALLFAFFMEDGPPQRQSKNKKACPRRWKI